MFFHLWKFYFLCIPHISLLTMTMFSFKFFSFLFIEVYSTYHVMLISGVQHDLIFVFFKWVKFLNKVMTPVLMLLFANYSNFSYYYRSQFPASWHMLRFLIRYWVLWILYRWGSGLWSYFKECWVLFWWVIKLLLVHSDSFKSWSKVAFILGVIWPLPPPPRCGPSRSLPKALIEQGGCSTLVLGACETCEGSGNCSACSFFINLFSVSWSVILCMYKF